MSTTFLDEGTMEGIRQLPCIYALIMMKLES